MLSKHGNEPQKYKETKLFVEFVHQLEIRHPLPNVDVSQTRIINYGHIFQFTSPPPATTAFSSQKYEGLKNVSLKPFPCHKMLW